MKATIRTIQHGDDESTYSALMFTCPGCAEMHGNDGIHILPVNTTLVQPSWDWDGDLEFPTISPSILTGKGGPQRCHSFLRNGNFQFLSDSTHSLAGRTVEMPDLPDWAKEDDSAEG